MQEVFRCCLETSLRLRKGKSKLKHSKETLFSQEWHATCSVRFRQRGAPGAIFRLVTKHIEMNEKTLKQVMNVEDDHRN